ncbi:transformation/transcription domain-associated protein-like [Centruroides sculpturatus]|uniref:transformation/transcription domain-associated protein-like n=1 Tax=Centruroides sculpturatus TaxID=218467 RepID=UPI000C6CAFAE|nr:transformation/transcription domain-associated protein-like [Centruroides sculpturatus]
MPGMVPSVLTQQDPVTQMNTYRSFVSMLVDPAAKDESKLKAAQELSEDLETIVSSPQYPSFLEHALKIFLKILQEGEPYFIAEHNVQQLRKLILEIIHRIPANDHLKPHARQILSLMFQLLEIENEENVLVCLRIIIELHKQFRPQFSPEIQRFLQFVKNIYKELPNHLNKIFEPRHTLKVKDISEVNISALLMETFTITNIQTEKKNQDATILTYNIIPKAVLSLKVLAELPIIVVLMYQLYKQSVHQEVSEFIPLIMITITLQPTSTHRSSSSFNKEVFVDFMAAQIKTLSFLAYIVRIYQDIVNIHSSQLAKGMLGLLTLCPHEVAHLRKELLIAARHILATDLREKFVSCLNQFFDETILIGSGWTAYESLRPLAYSTLADLVHHVRQHLPLKELSSAVTVFSKNVHDESLPTSIQTMSCKLLLNLVECIRGKSDRESGNGRELLMRMLEVFVLKFKTIAKLQLPVLMQKYRQQSGTTTSISSQTSVQPPATPTTPQMIAPPMIGLVPSGFGEVKLEVKDDTKTSFSVGGLNESKDEKRFGFPASQASNYTVSDCRSLVKTLVCGVKTITWGIASCKVIGDSTLTQNKQFQPKETLVFIRLAKYALQALDIYTLSVPAQGQPQPRQSSVQTVRSKEEKEVLEHFAGVFTMMNPMTFREVFSTTIEYVVERIYKNFALQLVANSFLANVSTSPVFATILVEYLLNRMDEMGSNMERSNLYLKLFKLVFGSVSLFAAENEQMLKLCNERLNSLQSGLHKQHMKDLFVELCLTVPVRLSSLLPYLPMLMDPLVSALNGSQTLVSQGLRTLELCVDNLQPDFLYDHIQPVRAELMQALWRTLRNPVDGIAQVAFRVLGKFGGGNRKMMMEPQKLEYNDSESVGPCITVYFQEQKNPIALPVDKIVETAFNALKSSTTDPFYRKQCWEVIKGFLVANIQQDDNRHNMQQLFSHPRICILQLVFENANEQNNMFRCISLKFLFERMTLKWVFAHQYLFLRALLFVMMDLTGEVSSGAVDMAKSNLEKMLTLCGTPIIPDGTNKELIDAQTKSLHEVIQELVRQVTSPNTCVREQAMHSLKVLAKVSNKSVTEIMDPHKDVLADMIPPKKHLLRHQPANAQIGLMDGNTFCTTLEPRLFTIDLNIVEHKVFFTELIALCETEDNLLLRLPCYKAITNLVPLRKSALRALAACHYIPQCKDKILNILYKALNTSNVELQVASFECMKKFLGGAQFDMEKIHNMIRGLLGQLGDVRNLNLGIVQHYSYLTQLFPNIFNKKFCEHLLNHLKHWLEIIVSRGSQRLNSSEMKMCICIVNIFHQMPVATEQFIEPLVTLILKTEKALLLEASSPFREPLTKFLQHYPSHTLELLLNETYIQDESVSRFLEYLLKGESGRPFREILQQNPAHLINMALGVVQSQAQLSPSPPVPGMVGQLSPSQSGSTLCQSASRNELQYQAIRTVSLLVQHDDQWLSTQPHLIECLRKVWISDEFQLRHQKADSVDFVQWKEPKLLAKCLLNYVKHHPNEIELLFQLLRAFTGRFIPDFEFLRDFLENTVANNYTVEWKRMAFFKFVELFHDNSFPQELKAKILQYIIIPSFAVAFERGEGERLIGGPPTPDQDLPDNVISMFINKVIDPEKPFGTSDAVRILLLQFSCLLVEQASPHIHDAANKRQGMKLRRLMTFAWPCLLAKNCVDPATKYHGHLLLAHIIAKFAIHKRIVLQVFHSLLKAHAVEARTVVKQALEILTPAMPARMEDGNTMLTHWTKKIIVEEGHTLAQLVHMLQLLVRHYKVLLFIILILKLVYVEAGPSTSSIMNVRRTIPTNDPQELKRVRNPSGTNVKPVPDSNRPVDKAHADAVVNFLLRMACQVNDTATAAGSSGELLSRKCVGLLKTALKPDVWPNAELKLAWFDKLLSTVVYVEAGPSTSSIMNVRRTIPTNDPQELKRVRNPSGTNVKPVPDSNRPVDKAHADAVVNFLLRMACQVNDTATAAGSSGELLSRKCVGLLKTALKPDVWPNAELKLAWFDKLLSTVVIKSVHSLLSRLMSIFPTEPTTSNVASKYEELECLYASVSKVVYEGLSNYESRGATTSSLFGTLMILKAACINNPCYIDRLITSFMKVLQKMTREHLNPSPPETSPMGTDLLILSLDLVKNRVGVMGQEMRKAFIGTILVGLIEKSPDVKVLKAITKMVEDWVKSKSPIAVNQSPTLREKSILLVKMMQFIEKRFPDDLELNAQFLELVNYVYRDETLKGTELTSKLEPAFMAGLRCVQSDIRAKFFEVFDASMRKRLHDRLLYIVCSQNWDTMGPHFWIKQCLELLLVTAVTTTTIQSSTTTSLLPSVTSVINLADSQERANFAMVTSVKEEPADVDCVENKDDEEIDIELSSTEDGHTKSVLSESTSIGHLRKETDPHQNLQQQIIRQAKFIEGLKEVKTISFLTATSQLCHFDTSLAQHLWIQVFPKLWKILSDKQQNVLASELIPFLCSGSHVVQKDCHPSAIGTFMEALSQCVPSVPIKPSLLKYIGKSHNLWHRSSLLLENMAFEKGVAPQVKSRGASAADCYEFEPVTSPQHETLDALADMYSMLKEEDLWAGLWQKRAKYTETNIAIAYEQQGFFEQAQGAFELAMSKARQDHNTAPASPALHSEYRLWEEHWIRCSKELNQWDMLLDYSTTKGCSNPPLILESAWRIPNWTLMKEALAQVENSSPKEMPWKVNLYRGYLAICHPDEHHLNIVERVVEVATGLCIREWRRLPHIVSHIHLPMLQAAQQIMELQEAAQIHQGLLPTHMARTTSLHDMKAIVKTWRNRLPVLSDDLSHWSDIFTWRQHHYQAIVSHYEVNQGTQTAVESNQAMLGVHASAQSIIHYGKIARKHNLTGVCLDTLNRIHSIPSVPIVDCFQKIRQQVKCYLQMSSIMGKNELQEGLEVIESTNLKYFGKEMIAEFYALKGMFLAQSGRSDEANKAFSAAVQMHDTLVKAWALWGDYLESIFTRDRWESRQIHVGISALTCYLHACRHQNENKSRKYLAKVLWLLNYDDEKSSLAEAVDKYNVGVPPVQWLPWIPQLLTCLVRFEGRVIMNLLSHVGRMFPQAVYFPIRTLYLTLKIEQRERYKSGELTLQADVRRSGNQVSSPAPSHSIGSLSSSPSTSTSSTEGVPNIPVNSPNTTESHQSSQQQQASETGPIRATPPMWRCSRIMHMQRDLHPTILSSLEGIVDQMVWFRENWYEEVLRQLRQGLAKCYAVAFENRGAVSEAPVTLHTLNFVKKLVSTFGVGIENVSSVTTTFSSAASESLARRAQATAQDPVFQKMKGQFTADFDFSVPGAMKLHNLINKLKKWIKILEAKTKLLPKSFLIEEKCRFLSNFSQQTADVEVPGEFLLPKPFSVTLQHGHYFLRIGRFMPRVEIVQKHNTAARRLYIRGHNGKICPYLVVNDACLSDARREERVLQLLRMLNNYLGKQKETSRRFLNFTVPRVVPISPQMRLVEDNPTSVSLLDIYKQRCAKRGIEHDAPIARYYERLATVQARGSQASHQVLRDILKDVQSIMVPRDMMREWASHTYTGATNYWTFRKQFTLQLSLAGFAEFVLHLTRLNPDMMYIHQDSGLMNISYFKFDVDDGTGELDANRPVPFRLTPNISEFITPIGVGGPMTAAMIATARCLVQPNFRVQALLRAILIDEILAWYKKRQDESPCTAQGDTEGELITMVTKAVVAIMGRLHNLATFDGADSKVSTLVAAANSHDNLCRMDPAWHPWL